MLQGFFSGSRCGHSVAEAYEHRPEQFAMILIVVDEKDGISHDLSCGFSAFPAVPEQSA
jgi:hypothetical protein